MDSNSLPPKRQSVLVAIYSDGFIECYAEKNIDLRIARVPQAQTPRGECIAEDVFELLLPSRFRQLFRRDYLRATGSTLPLSPETAHAWLRAGDAIRALNATADKQRGRVA